MLLYHSGFHFADLNWSFRHAKLQENILMICTTNFICDKFYIFAANELFYCYKHEWATVFGYLISNRFDPHSGRRMMTAELIMSFLCFWIILEHFPQLSPTNQVALCPLVLLGNICMETSQTVGRVCDTPYLSASLVPRLSFMLFLDLLDFSPDFFVVFENNLCVRFDAFCWDCCAVFCLLIYFICFHTFVYYVQIMFWATRDCLLNFMGTIGCTFVLFDEMNKTHFPLSKLCLAAWVCCIPTRAAFQWLISQCVHFVL